MAFSPNGPRGTLFINGPQGQIAIRETSAGLTHKVNAVTGPGGSTRPAAWTMTRHHVVGPLRVGHGGGLLPTGLLVPLALLLLALGLWLTPRAVARLRDRMPWLVPYLRRWAVENRWGVLLIPVTMFGLVVFGVRPWTVAAVLVSVIAAVRWPKVAADLVPVALVGFAAWGFAIASSWQSLAAGRNGHQVIYGAVQVSSPQMALLAGAEASVRIPGLRRPGWCPGRSARTRGPCCTPGPIPSWPAGSSS